MKGALLLVPAALFAAPPLVTPPPRYVEWTGTRVRIPSAIAAETQEELQAARLLAAEMRRLHRVPLTVGGKDGIVMAVERTARGKSLLDRLPGAGLFRSAPGDEAYLLDAGAGRVSIVGRSARALLHGVQTLLQLAGRDGSLEAARIVDYPQLSFRAVHICIFPNTELQAVRQAMLVAARFKYNAVVLEPWASMQSASHPETAYEGAYTAAQIRELVQFGRALGLEMIPMLNSWGHASGMRARSSQHVVLDRFPRFRPLYEEDGWSFCLTNPGIYPHLFDRYAELIEVFGKPRWFHTGLDEAWGHRGLMRSEACRGSDPAATAAAHLVKLHDWLAARKIRMIAWHDMLLQRDHPALGRVSPANSLPPFDTHRALDRLPNDVAIAAWNYDQTSDWPVPKYFQDLGYPVVVSPWKTRANVTMLLNTAKKIGAMGLLETTWDSLEIALPTIGEAGILAWSAPGYSLDAVPFEHLLHAVRQYPLGSAPALDGAGGAFQPIVDDPTLPRVLLIGDSISIGYTLPVRALLRNAANVHRPATNCGSTRRAVENLDRWLGDGRWDAIHFNFGLHDSFILDEKERAVPIEEYERNLRAIVARLRATGAALVWATTTPIAGEKLLRPRDRKPVHDFYRKDIEAYNAAALRVMRENGIVVNDLYGFALPRLAEIQNPDDVHFNASGSDQLAAQVASALRSALARSR